MDGNDVGSAEKGLPVHLLYMMPFEHFIGNVGIESQNLHIKGQGKTGDPVSDIPEPDDSQSFIEQFDAGPNCMNACSDQP